MNGSASVPSGKGNMIWGILMLICGFLAITLPLASGIGVAIVIGWLLLISGVWHLLFGFRSGSGIGGFLWQLLLAIVYGAAGLMLLLRPLAGLAWLTLVLATFLLIEAVSRVCSLFQHPSPGECRLGVVRCHHHAPAWDPDLGALAV